MAAPYDDPDWMTDELRAIRAEYIADGCTHEDFSHDFGPASADEIDLSDPWADERFGRNHYGL